MSLNKGEQMVRYYGYYSSAKALAQAGGKIPCILEPELSDKAFRKNWARLIQKIYKIDAYEMAAMILTHINKKRKRSASTRHASGS